MEQKIAGSDGTKKELKITNPSRLRVKRRGGRRDPQRRGGKI
jgi:hypothetical protein